MSDWIESYGNGSSRSSNEFFLPVETELTKDPAAGFGLKFGGANTVEEAREYGYGVLITGTKKNTPAAGNPATVKPWQIMRVNDMDLTDATLESLKGMPVVNHDFDAALHATHPA